MSGTTASAAVIAACRWQDAGGGLAAATRIGSFLDSIGLAMAVIEHGGGQERRQFVPGIIIDHGVLTLDPMVPIWPGDLLHEAGHVAVTEPQLRAGLCELAADPGEEMAAIAWSWAGAIASGIAADQLFHSAGYRGGGGYLAENFTAGRFVGVPMLGWFGLCDEAYYPAMKRWLR